jgi:toxin-antitoxin system PIN domain toxin
MFVVDTNILVYAANEDQEENSTCKPLVEKWCNQTSIWHSTWAILYEFMRVVTHPRVFVRPWSTSEAWKFIEGMLQSPGLVVLTETERHEIAAAEFFAAHPFVTGNLIFDAHTAILMKEHGISTIYTRDSEFYKFSFANVIDPLKQKG